MSKKYTIEILSIIVENSISVAECLSKLGLKPAGGNYKTFKRLVEQYNIDTSHFKGQGHNCGKKNGPKRYLNDYLSNKFPITSYRLKRRLISECVLLKRCSSCQREYWMGEEIPLELDHIDGNNQNNSLDNLRLLCPNCHAQTDNYRGKKKKGAYPNRQRESA